MESNKHAQMNSLVQQISNDAEAIRGTAGRSGHFTPDQIKLMRDMANAIVNKLNKYEALQMI